MAHGHGSKPFWYHFGDRCTTYFLLYFSGDWGVHWGWAGVLTPGHMEKVEGGGADPRGAGAFGRQPGPQLDLRGGLDRGAAQ